MKKLRFSGRAAVVCSLILAIGIPSVAMGFGEGRNMLLGKRNPSNNPSLALSTETEIIANNSTYGTRQSNKKDGDGGGAIYGCRSSLGNEPCVQRLQPQGRPRVLVHHRRRRGRPHRDRQPDRRAVHDQRHRRRHRPQRRSRRRQGGGRLRRRGRRDRARRQPAVRAVGADAAVSANSRGAVSATKTREPGQRLHGQVQQGREQVLVHGLARSARRRRPHSASPPRRTWPTASTSTPAPTAGSFHLQVIC